MKGCASSTTYDVLLRTENVRPLRPMKTTTERTVKQSFLKIGVVQGIRISIPPIHTIDNDEGYYDGKRLFLTVAETDPLKGHKRPPVQKERQTRSQCQRL